MLYVVKQGFYNMEYKKYDYFTDEAKAVEWAEETFPEVDEIWVEEYIENDGKYFISRTIIHWGEDDEEVLY